MGHLIGIDLGTHFSVAAKVNSLGQPEILPTRDGRPRTLSTVLFDGDVPIVGGRVKWPASPAPDIVQFVKCAMGDPTWRYETASGLTLRPEEVSAIILKRLKEDAELALNGPVTDAVITVPACYDDRSRIATVNAGTIAGLTVRGVLNEPTAAALAYGLDQSVEGTVLVYNLGGGTFDVSVIRISDGTFETLATRGDRSLGGIDWDNLLMKLLNQRFQEQDGPNLVADRSTELQLRVEAEIAKHTLSTLEQTRVVLSTDRVTEVISVSRAEFEELTAHLLGRTRDLATMVVQDARLCWSHVDRLLLAGGSTRMPMVRATMEHISGKSAERFVNPDEVVAFGAAIQAQLIGAELNPGQLPDSSRATIQEVTSHGLGVIARDAHSGIQRNVIVIPANARIPATWRDVFQTVRNNQTRIDVEVTQGNATNPGQVLRLDRITINLPPYPTGAPIEIICACHVDQVITVKVNDLTTGKSLGTFPVRSAATMNDAQVIESTRKISNIEVT